MNSEITFENVYSQYSAPIFKNINRIVHDEHITQDIMQEVFLTYFQNMAKIDLSRVGSWLFVVSFNKSISYLKRQNSKVKIYLEDFPNLADSEIQLVETDEITDWQLKVIEEAINNLSARKRQIIKLLKFEHKSIEEVSQVTGLSSNTIQYYLRQAIYDIKNFIFRKYPTGTISLSIFLFYSACFTTDGFLIT